MRKEAYSNPAYRRIAALARPYYDAEGHNSWKHIQDVRRRASAMTRSLYGRQLTPAEYAAIMLHDSTKRDLGGKRHAETGAMRAAEVLAAALTPLEAAEASAAIAAHDSNLPEFPSTSAELLASADANPPDIGRTLSKAHAQDPYGDSHIAEFNKAKYGSGGWFNYPGIYSKYYGDRLARYRKTIDGLDADKVRSIYEKYEKRNGAWNG